METITCGNIRFSKQDIKELDGIQVMVSIPKTEIVSITVSYGESVEKPILQIIAGILLALLGFCIGVWPLLPAISNLGAQRGTHSFLFGFAAPLILIGIFLIVPVFRMCDYLLITTRSGRRKLQMKGCSPSEIANAGKALGYFVTEIVAQ